MAEPRYTGYLESGRLRMVPATVQLLEADLAGSTALSRALGAEVPDAWPPDLYDRHALEYTAGQVRRGEPRGWSTWYLVARQLDPPRLIGVCGFKDWPDANGSVEIAYSILPEFRNSGLATEAVERLVSWAFTHARVTEVSAETFPHLVSSIRVLEKAGFRPAGAGSERGVIRYAVSRRSLD